MNKLRIIVVFVFSGLISFLLIPSTFSILKSFATANKTLAMAKWIVSLDEEGVNDSLEIANDNYTTANYTLKVISESEVDIKYTIVISNLPTGVKVSFDGGNFITEDNNTITFSDIGTILYSDNPKMKTHTLTFKATTGSAIVNDQEVDIDVIARQFLKSG